MNLQYNFQRNNKGIGTVFAMVFFLLIVMVVFASFVIILSQNTGLEQVTINSKQMDQDRYTELQTVSIANPETAVLNNRAYILCDITNNGTLPSEFIRLWIRDITNNTVGNTLLSPSLVIQPGTSTEYFKSCTVLNASNYDQFSFWFVTTRGNLISAYPNINQFSNISTVGASSGQNSGFANNTTPIQLYVNPTKPNDLIYMAVAFDDGNSLNAPFSTPTMNWVTRNTSDSTDHYSHGDAFLRTYYAISPGGPINITLTVSGTENNDYYWAAVAFAISNVNLAKPFDSSGPQTSIGSSSPAQDTIKISSSNELAIGAFEIDTLTPNIAPGAGFTQVLNPQITVGATGDSDAYPRSVWVETSVIPNPTTSLSVSCNYNAPGRPWAIILDAVNLVVTPPIAPVSLSPISGPIGQLVTVSGGGFAANSHLIATFDGTQVPFSFSTDNFGNIQLGANFTVPTGSSAGNKTVTIIDTQFNYASANFTVTTPSITLSPQIGPVGTTATVIGSNFITNSIININFDGNSVVTNPSTITADATGSFAATFVVPSGPARANQVLASDGVNSAYANFNLIPTISLTPTLGLNGIQVAISGEGFAANSNLIVAFDGATVSSSPANPSTNATGSFSDLFFIPQSSTPGLKIVSVTDAGSNSNSTTFDLLFTPTVPAPTLNPLSPIALGTSVTGRVTVTGALGITPTGTVTFQVSTDSGSTWSSFGTVKTLVAGSATSDSYTPQAVGSGYQLRVVYNGDVNYDITTGPSSSLTVNPGNPIVSVPTFIPASTVALGTSVTGRVTVTGALGITPTGTVTFQVSTDSGSTWSSFGTVKTLVAGSATSDSYTPQTSSNNYQFRAVYNGDSNYNTATGASAILTVNKGTASVSASSFAPASPITLGSSVMVSVSVSAPSGVTTVPTGSVQFMVKIGGGSYANFGTAVDLSGGSASISYTPSTIGTYNFQATYQGDNSYLSSTTGAASGTLTVYIPSSVGTLLSASSPIALGGTTTDTATVTPQTYLYKQVTYVGAGNGASGTSGSLSVPYPSGLAANDLLLLQTTVRDTTNSPTQPAGWSLLYGPDSSGTGRQWIYFKFATGSETGTLSVTFAGSNLKIARMYDFRNVAALSFTESSSFGSSAGSTTISAQPVTTADVNRLAVSFVFDTYSNTLAPFSGSSGGTWVEPVLEYTTTTSSRGGVQLQTATMTSAGTISGGSYSISTSTSWGVRAFALIPSAALATGNVNFQVLAPGGSWNTYNTQALTSGTATSISYSPNGVGTWYFRAVYSGDSNYVGSQSGDSDEPLVVGVGTAIVDAATFTPDSPIVLSTVETVSVGVSGPTGFIAPTGNVQFQVSINSGAFTNFGSVVPLSSGAASISYTPSAIGTYNFRAEYQGDSNYESGTTGGASGPLSVKYNPNVPAPSLSQNPVVVSHSVTVSSVVSGVSGVTPTGSVTFQVKIGAGSWTNIGSAVTLVSGGASTTYTPATVDTYQFQVIYSGDGNYLGATSSATSLTVSSGTFGNTQQSGSGFNSIKNTITGGQFTCAYSGTAQSITAYIQVSSSTHLIKAALYTTDGTLVGTTVENSVTTSNDGWVTFAFSGTHPALTAGTSYIIVVWANGASGNANLYYSSTTGGIPKYDSVTYGNWPGSATFTTSNVLYSIYCTYTIP